MAFREQLAEQRIRTLRVRAEAPLFSHRERALEVLLGHPARAMRVGTTQLAHREVPRDAYPEPQEAVRPSVRNEARSHLPYAKERFLEDRFHVDQGRKRPAAAAASPAQTCISVPPLALRAITHWIALSFSRRVPRTGVRA